MPIRTQQDIELDRELIRSRIELNKALVDADKRAQSNRRIVRVLGLISLVLFGILLAGNIGLIPK